VLDSLSWGLFTFRNFNFHLARFCSDNGAFNYLPAVRCIQFECLPGAILFLQPFNQQCTIFAADL